MKFLHSMIRVKDEEKSLKFYQNLAKNVYKSIILIFTKVQYCGIIIGGKVAIVLYPSRYKI